MADISEAEAVLHLKRALGEIDAGDALPPPLPPVQPKPAPPPAKVPKVAPSQPPMSSVPAQPSIGPTPRNEIRQPSSQTPAPPPRSDKGPGRGPGPMPPGMLPGKGMDPMALPPFPLPGIGGKDGMPPGLVGFTMPGMGMGKGGPSQGAAPQPRPPGASASGGGTAAAAAAAAAAGSGKKQKNFEIQQSKVGTIVGKNAATLNAIKSYSKAQCFVEQHHPDEDKATIYVVGTDKEMAKCKQTVLAICDGSMSVSTLFTLAGVSMPRGGVEDWEPPRSGGPVNPGLAAQPVGTAATAATASPWGAPPPMLPGMTGPPPLPPMMLAQMAAAGAGAPPALPGTSIPGMPENSQMQQNLNDYYARWWSTYASQQQEGGGEDSEQTATAFDKEALQRLAERAAKGIEEPPPPQQFQYAPTPPPESTVPPGPPPDAGGVCSCGAPYTAGANFCSSCGAKISKGGPPPTPSHPAEASSPGSPPSAQPSPPSAPSTGPAIDHRASSIPSGPTSALSAQSGQAPRGPITLKGFLRPSNEPAKPKKDDDSVQKMMERLQGNVVQTKQTIAMSEVAPPPPPQQRMRGVMGLMGEEEDPRTRADFEFEALVSRMQQAQSQDDVEHVGREILIRFPSFNPQQVADIMSKLDSAQGLQNYQNGDLMAELCRMVLPRLKEFTSTQFTSLTSTLAAWTRRPDRVRSPRFLEFSKAFFSAASTEMSSRLMTFAPHELNCCLAAFVSVGFNEHKFFASVGRAALARHSSFAPVQLTALLAILSEMRLMHTDLFNAAAAFLSTRTKDLRPVDIIRVLRSFAKCSVQHPVLCKAMSDEVISRSRDKSSPPFKAEDLCEVSWALCVLQHYQEAIFRAMFKALEKQPSIASDSLLQVYEVHLALDAEQRDAYSRYMPANHLIDQLEDHYKECRKDERRCSERQRNDVASVLKSLVEGSVHVNHRTSAGLLVDVAALRKRSSTDGFIHVDLDSNTTVVRSLDQDEATSAALVTEGAVAMRRRVLQKNGLRLVTVKEAEWRDLDDSKDKRRHLRQLLSSLGDVLQ